MDKKLLVPHLIKGSGILFSSIALGSFGAWLGFSSSIPSVAVVLGTSIGSILGLLFGYQIMTTAKEREGGWLERSKQKIRSYKYSRQFYNLQETQKIALFGSLFLVAFAALGALVGDSFGARAADLGMGRSGTALAPAMLGLLAGLGMSIFVLYSLVVGGLKTLRSSIKETALGALAGLTTAVYFDLVESRMTFFLMLVFSVFGLLLPLMFRSGYLKDQLFEDDISYQKFRKNIGRRVKSFKPAARFLPQQTTIEDIVLAQRKNEIGKIELQDPINLSADKVEPIYWKSHEMRIPLEEK